MASSCCNGRVDHGTGGLVAFERLEGKVRIFDAAELFVVN